MSTNTGSHRVDDHSQSREIGSTRLRAIVTVAVTAACLLLFVAGPSEARGPGDRSQGPAHSRSADHSQGAAHRAERATAALAANGLIDSATSCDVFEVVFAEPHGNPNADAMAGCYVENGIQNGKGFYLHVNGDNHRVYWSAWNGDPAWVMHSDSTSIFFFNPADTPTPPADGWSGKGGAPYPTVVYP